MSEGGGRRDSLWAHLVQADASYGPIAFWFWNDALREDELLRQLHRYHQGGFGGVIIHPRVGLSAEVGYLTPRYFALVRHVVAECAALGLKVILYDEGSYPSGAACGQVVAENPDYAARGLALVQQSVQGPWQGYWRPSAGRSLLNRLVAVVCGRERDGRIDPTGLRLLEPGPQGLVRVQVEEGDWRLCACFDVPSGGHIRGVLPEHEDGSALAPAAADLMNPDAVAAFIRLTHDAYARHIGEFFGSTVIALFTDEPNPRGRGSRRGVQPYTPGFERMLNDHAEAEIKTWLPALWLDYGPDTEAFREAYARGIHARVRAVFYGAQSNWCRRHGLALTGHPADSNDMASLVDFDWPGQDMVWRWVTPGNESGIAGEHSVAPLAATSAARAWGRRRIATELFGAYGWRLSLDEAKWLLDWHFARGNNLIIPHALFYSVRAGRAYESEPDLGIHNVWGPHFAELMGYARRMSWLLTDCTHHAEVAVLGNGEALPWTAARALFEHQIDFLYIDDAALHHAVMRDGRLQVGTQAYRVVVVDGNVTLSPKSTEALAAFERAGGIVLQAAAAGWLERVRALAAGDLMLSQPAPSLRVLRLSRMGRRVYALFNEGENAITCELSVVRETGASETLAAEWWDPLRQVRASVEPRRGLGADCLVAALHLERRESRLLVLGAGDSDGVPAGAEGSGPRERVAGERAAVALVRLGAGEQPTRAVDLTVQRRVTDEAGKPVAVDGLGDWTERRELECFSGTLVYTAEWTQAAGQPVVGLDLGRVGDAAEVRLNGKLVGRAMWAPYRLKLDPADLKAGHNELEIRVSNSAANRYEGAMQPSGLIGPVRLIVAG